MSQLHSSDEGSLQSLYTRLIKQFPALFQMVVSLDGKIVFHQTNHDARESYLPQLFVHLQGDGLAFFPAHLKPFRIG